MLALLLAACSEPPRAYQIGYAIPLGSYNIEVRRTTVTNLGDRGLLMVHFELWCARKPPDLRKFMNKVRFSLRDRDGKKYDGAAIPEPSPGTDMSKVFEGMRKSAATIEERLTNMGLELEHWTAVFEVPANAHGFTLYVENRAPQPGQPRTATVALDL